MYSQREGGRGESWTREKGRGATQEGTDSKGWIENTNMTERTQKISYLQSINSYFNTCRKVPLQVNFFR